MLARKERPTEFSDLMAAKPAVTPTLFASYWKEQVRWWTSYPQTPHPDMVAHCQAQHTTHSRLAATAAIIGACS